MATRHATTKNDRQTQSAGRQQPRQRQRTEDQGLDDQDYLQRGNEQFQGLVRDHEGQAVLAALALGFGIGLAIGYAIGGPSENESSRWHDRVTAEGIGRKLLQRIDQVLPEAITSRLHG
jgi:hypothetical protein